MLFVTLIKMHGLESLSLLVFGFTLFFSSDSLSSSLRIHCVSLRSSLESVQIHAEKKR
jgi:hypothetical protein